MYIAIKMTMLMKEKSAQFFACIAKHFCLLRSERYSRGYSLVALYLAYFVAAILSALNQITLDVLRLNRPLWYD